MRHRTNRAPSYALTPDQFKMVDTIEHSLPTEDQRNSFRLRVGAKLKLVAPIGGVPDELLHNCIDATLTELIK